MQRIQWRDWFGKKSSHRRTELEIRMITTVHESSNIPHFVHVCGGSSYSYSSEVNIRILNRLALTQPHTHERLTNDGDDDNNNKPSTKNQQSDQWLRGKQGRRTHKIDCGSLALSHCSHRRLCLRERPNARVSEYSSGWFVLPLLLFLSVFLFPSARTLYVCAFLSWSFCECVGAGKAKQANKKTTKSVCVDKATEWHTQTIHFAIAKNHINQSTPDFEQKKTIRSYFSSIFSSSAVFFRFLSEPKKEQKKIKSFEKTFQLWNELS